MEKPNVIIVSSGEIGRTAQHALLNDDLGKTVIVVDSPMGIDATPPTPYIAQYQPKERGFICKGKHQYREQRREEKLENGTICYSEWICQCGKKI